MTAPLDGEFRHQFAPLRVPKAAELVSATIRRRIVRGELQEGDALPSEAELMEQFEVSRPTLREALRILESELLITVHRGSRKGARVHTPDSGMAAGYAGLLLQMSGTTIEDVLDTRSVLEIGAVRALAEHSTAVSLSRLEGCLTEESASIDDLDRFAGAAVRFHHLIIEATSNHSLLLLAQMLEHITDRHAATVKEGEAGHRAGRALWRTKTHEVHEALVGLIRAGEADGAEHLWRAHLRESHRAMLERTSMTKTVLDLFE